MDLPISLLSETIRVGTIIYFYDKHLTQTDEPHPHVVIYSVDESTHLLVGTSKFENRRRHIEHENINRATLVTIRQSDEENTLTLDTHLDCNSFHSYTTSYLSEKLKDGKATLRGNVKNSVLQQIIEGIKASGKHEPDTKQIITSEIQKVIDT